MAPVDERAGGAELGLVIGSGGGVYYIGIYENVVWSFSADCAVKVYWCAGTVLT